MDQLLHICCRKLKLEWISQRYVSISLFSARRNQETSEISDCCKSLVWSLAHWLTDSESIFLTRRFRSTFSYYQIELF